MKNKTTYTSQEIKNKLRRGDYEIISKLTKGKYTAGTVQQQILGARELKQPVIDAAIKLFESREKLFANK